MSQPVAWIGSVKMQETAFKKMLRSEAVKKFAAIIEETIFNNEPNYYIFRYLKKEGALFAYFFFNYGNSHTLNEALDWLPLKDLAVYSDQEDAGVVFSTLDSLNFEKEDIHLAYLIRNNELQAVDQLSDEVLNKLYKDIQKYFFKEVDKDFANNFYGGRIVDKSIVKRCKKLAENRRIQNVLKNLDKASFTKPLHIFDNYFYNGKILYHQFGKCTILDEIDPMTFVQTPYGAADGTHVVIEEKTLRADPGQFKKLQKSETCYYITKDQVFNHRFEIIPEADASSFKLVDEYYALDANAVYFVGNRFTKESLGQYKIHSGGYFHVDKILIGEKAVYLGNNRLAVDPASFRILEDVTRKHTGVYGSIIYVAEDHEGKMVLYTEFDKRGHYSHYKLIRTDNPAELLIEIEGQDKEKWDYKMNYAPPEMKDNQPEESYERFTNWLNIYFTEYYQEYKTRFHFDFYRKINNYFAVCFKIKKYDDIVALYEKIKENAWINPFLFHHTACAFTALGEYDRAVDEVRKAVIYGYEHLGLLFEDKDLAPLFQLDRFIRLQEYYRAGNAKVASLELLQSIISLPPVNLPPDGYEVKNFVSSLGRKIYFPDVPTVVAQSPDHEGYIKEYGQVLQQVFDEYFFLDDYDYNYKNYESLNPKVHYDQLTKVFRKAHGYNGYIHTEKLTEVLEIGKLLKASLENSRYQSRNAAVREELQGDKFFAYILNEVE